jgi:uncharacterized protein
MISTANNTERVVLYGSPVRGDTQDDSDYGVSVFLKDLNERWEEADKIALTAMNFFDETSALIRALPYYP